MKETSFGIVPYLIIKNKVYLFVSKPSKYSLYGFFKGKIEEGETPSLCAIREFQEETNILIDKNYLEKFFFQKSNQKNVGIYLVNYFNINFKNFLLNKENYSGSWVSLEKLRENIIINQEKILNELFLNFKNKIYYNIIDNLCRRKFYGKIIIRRFYCKNGRRTS